MANGLYCIDEFKDNCGFGLAAHIKGEPSHRLLEQAIESLTCMTHRGGIAADGKTGDGCGLLIQKPDEFFRTEVKEKFDVELTEQYGVGSIMFGQGLEATEQAQTIIAQRMAAHGLEVVAWRDVPTNSECLGYPRGVL